MKSQKYEESIGAVISCIPLSTAMPIDSWSKVNGYNSSMKFLLVKSPRGDWNFVKGHKENGENDLDTLKREIFEETGITAFKSLYFIDKINYMFSRQGFEVNKEVRFYCVLTDTTDISISSEHIDYAWLRYEQAKKTLTFYQSRLILERCIMY
jgi:bis(5'-nucleosidyl)-tetraphosphatase